MKRALLLQLPVPGFLWPALDANIPLAAGYLAAWARRQAKGWEVDVVPWHEADVLGDEALVRALLRRTPDLVGLSLSLWNAERSLGLARRLTERGIPVLVGGPEVDPDNDWLWAQGRFAGGVVGEGERPFVDVLRRLARGAPLAGIPGVATRPPVGDAVLCGPPLALANLPSPYRTGCLEPSPDRSLWLETLRGCPFGCAYCRYGKGHGAPRTFPSNWLPLHLAWALRHDVREVYLMDPSFNVRPDWEGVLRNLEAGNPDRQLAFHTELVADALRPGDGTRLAAAGLRSCEVGLQSVRPAALAAVGRSWKRDRWIAGVRELVGAGVTVSVGLIVGLPGDDLDGFRETLAFVGQKVPDTTLQVFPLALLPGTPLRRSADHLGLEYLSRPPYTVTRTRGYSEDDLAVALDVFEEATGLELDSFGALPLGGSWEEGEGGPAPYWSGVRLDAARVDPRWPELVAARAAAGLCLWIRGWTEEMPGSIGKLAKLLRHGVLTVVLEDTGAWPPERLWAILEAAGTGDHYLDRYFRFLYGAGARVVPRLAVVVDGEKPAAHRWLDRVRERADIVWSVPPTGGGWPSRTREAARQGDTVYVPGEPSEAEVRCLASVWEEDAGDVLFESGAATSVWNALRRTSAQPGPFCADEHRVTLP